jgi:glucose-1-phosphate thymidylyltransferase
MGRGSAWLDTGSIQNLNETAQFISSIERRQGLKIGCLEEISYLNKWITKKNIFTSILGCNQSWFLHSNFAIGRLQCTKPCQVVTAL